MKKINNYHNNLKNKIELLNFKTIQKAITLLEKTIKKK